MNNLFTRLASVVFVVAFSGGVYANCADDAVDTCNKKHPNPNSSSSAYDRYELCIKAQLGQKCPSGDASSKAITNQLSKNKKGMKPMCPKGYVLKVNWAGKRDRCITKNVVPKRATLKTR